jgi:aspartate carbamoyltransferase catalytic subunit
LNTHLLAVQNLNSNVWEKLIQASFNFSKNCNDSCIIPKHSNQISFLFWEPSTRTQLSFSIAAHKLNLHVHNLLPENSSLSKGETLLDTSLNLEAMGLSALVIRLKEENLLKDVASKLKTLKIICAGEGKTSHPSQALLDACTIYEHFNRLDNLKILFLGDVEHSRVYSSNREWLSWYANDIYHLSPSTQKLFSLSKNENVQDNWENHLGMFDIIIMLRPQLERHHAPLDLTHYHQNMGITLDRFAKIKKNAICMHPGPFYPNTEFANDLLQHAQFKIMRQVHWGVYARMSIFNFVLGK